MSHLVKRCIECREVRGATSFRVVRRAGRVEVCRWCEARARNEARAIRELQAKVRRLVHEEGDLIGRISRVRSRLVKARGHLAAMEGAVANGQRITTERAS